MTGKQEEFLSLIYANCELFADDYNIKCVPAIVGQAIVESNWGKSILATKYFNYFGMKCGSAWKGKSVKLNTQEEYTASTLTTIKDNFRVYNNMREGVKGYFEFINTNRYSNLKGVTDAHEYLVLLKADGYATSSKYVDTVLNVVEDYVYSWLMKNDEVVELRPLKEIAEEVIAGLWGNGATRKQKLIEAGYNYNSVQSTVNRLLKER